MDDKNECRLFHKHKKQIDQILYQIAGIHDSKTRIAIPGTCIAEPGDLLFFITHCSSSLSKDNIRINDSTAAMNPILEDFCIFDGFGQVIPIKRRRKKVWI